ncbi:ADP-glyceromanno-heptose 6-epimerase [Helicobacter pylori]|uniref:ADP-glyceromanno-heptose 6-epimerase n=1 Tax=Helicobacter pylori TaxID=210 RepID=UPI000FDDAE51|nr:ADP-glyceromanno-heptose 6-epimerase [Helicobacter pylori]RVZ54816.1 ADP-glyceromanno-heptose 6-epimerase [Helicobacter pylori]
MRYIDDGLENQTILITGGAGFVGSNLAFYFQENHPKAKVIILDKFRSNTLFNNNRPSSLGHFKNLIGFKGEVIVADINNPLDLRRLEKLHFDYLFHQAAVSDTTILDQELVMKTNYQAFLNLLEIAQSKKAKVIYASSAGVYGNTKAPNVVGKNESPENVYGFSKLCMDEFVLSHSSDNIQVGLRYFNVYGPREFYKEKTASMVLQLALSTMAFKEVKLFEFGEQLRDFVYIEDVIQANVKAMKAQKSGVYNVGYSQARSYNEIVSILKEHLGDFKVSYIKNPYAFFQKHTQAHIEPAILDLDYTPLYDLESGIKDYLPHIHAIFKEQHA